MTFVIASALVGSGIYIVVTQTNYGRRAIANGAGLFIDVKHAPVRFSLPEPSGPYPIGTLERHLIDGGREDPWVGGARELMVSIWYPAGNTEGLEPAPYMKPLAVEQFKRLSVESLGIDPEQIDAAGVRTHAWLDAPPDVPAAQQPVILFSPGGSLPRATGTFLVEELASYGYIVVTLDHTHESVVEFPDARLAVTAVPSGDGVLEKMIAVRVDDIQFVLDQLQAMLNGDTLDAQSRGLPAGLADSMDLSRVGVFGHSAGGFAAAQAMYEDRRIDAIVNMDGSMGYHISDGVFGEVTNQGLDRPFMLFGAGLSGAERLPHTHVHASDWKSLWQKSTGWKRDVYMPEGEHFSFTDHQMILPQLDEKLGVPDWLESGMIGTIEPEHAIVSARDYVKAFFDHHLRGDPARILEGPSPTHPYIDIIRD